MPRNPTGRSRASDRYSAREGASVAKLALEWHEPVVADFATAFQGEENPIDAGRWLDQAPAPAKGRASVPHRAMCPSLDCCPTRSSGSPASVTRCRRVASRDRGDGGAGQEAPSVSGGGSSRSRGLPGALRLSILFDLGCPVK